MPIPVPIPPVLAVAAPHGKNTIALAAHVEHSHTEQSSVTLHAGATPTKRTVCHTKKWERNTNKVGKKDEEETWLF
jgi:hypothetical protein